MNNKMMAKHKFLSANGIEKNVCPQCHVFLMI